MSISIDVLEAEVMNLGDTDRNRILERLLGQAMSSADASEIEASWLQEALRRKAAVEAGEMAMIPGDEAIARLEALLA
jgi:hypothetical protein